MKNDRTAANFFLALFIIAAALVCYLFLPTLNALTLGAVFTVLAHPVYRRLLRLMPKHESLAAILSLILIFVVIVVPVVLLASIVFNEAQGVYASLTMGSDSTLEQRILGYLAHVSPSLGSVDLSQYTRDFFVWLIGNIGVLFSQIASSAITVILSAFTLFYLLRDGARLREEIIETSPLTHTDTANILDTLTSMVGSVIRGTLVVAVVQGVIVGIGFYLFGLHNSVLWGSVSILCALVPLIGAGIVYIPAALVLWGWGHTLAAIGLAVWGFILCGSVDNFLRPHLIKSSANINPLLILLSVIGGLSVFGPMGLVLGPLALSLLLTLLRIYPSMRAKGRQSAKAS